MMKKYTLIKTGIIAILVLFMLQVQAQTVTVNSLAELLPYLDDDNADVKLAPGTYSISDFDINQGTFSNPLFVFVEEKKTMSSPSLTK